MGKLCRDNNVIQATRARWPSDVIIQGNVNIIAAFNRQDIARMFYQILYFYFGQLFFYKKSLVTFGTPLVIIRKCTNWLQYRPV